MSIYVFKIKGGGAGCLLTLPDLLVYLHAYKYIY